MACCLGMYNREEEVGREEERGRGEKHLVVMREGLQGGVREKRSERREMQGEEI